MSTSRELLADVIVCADNLLTVGGCGGNLGLLGGSSCTAQADSLVQAFCKISENRHTFARLRYVKDDGLPAFYSPDFLVRTASAVYLVETKGQDQTIHPNVQRKRKAALAWCERINGLTQGQRGGPPWHYVLLAENVLYEWQGSGAHLAELLDYARLRPLASASLQTRLP